MGAAAAGAAASLAFASQAKGANLRHRETRTLFFDLSHEQHQGHEYHFVVGRRRFQLRPIGPNDATLMAASQQNRFVQSLPSGTLTHVAENVQLPAKSVQMSYLIKDPDTTTGTWGMSAIFLLPAKSSFSYAYAQARQKLVATDPLPHSAKRRKYGLPPALTLQDLLDEQDTLDTTDWATAMVNLHPELLSADSDSAAHIQTTHIRPYGALTQLGEVLGIAGTALPQQASSSSTPGWATLVPYTDDDGVTPLKATKGNNKGLILYDSQWQPTIKTVYVAAAMKPAIRGVKDDTSLGSDVTSKSPTAPPDASLTGSIWLRNDGASSVDATNKSGSPATAASNANYALSNITPNYNGYSLTATTDFTSGTPNVTLAFKNWYVRWLGLFIQFYDGDAVVPASKVPPIVGGASEFNTANNEIFIGFLTPEFTIFGIPVQSSGNTITFPFPTSVATRAKILASGLGFGSHTYQDTELVGIIMTSIFNLSLPMMLIAFGIGATVDAFVKAVVVPFANLLVQEILIAIEGGQASQALATFWRAIVKGITNPTGPLLAFLTALGEFLAAAEVTEALTDCIPLVGAILQAIGALGALAEVTETSCEIVVSPWTYEYDLVGTYDLSVEIKKDPRDPAGFPAAAATYKVTVVFDNGTPNVQTLNMPGGTVQTLPHVVFPAVPLGGMVTITVGFYSADGSNVGNGKVGPVGNVPASNPVITITEVALPLGPGVIYQHKQKTSLDGSGNHLWACGPAPAAPASTSSCGPSPNELCAFRNITVNTELGFLGYGWQSFNEAGCTSGGAGQLDQIANIASFNASSGNAQTGYVTTPCALQNPVTLVYDPLGRPGANYYLDNTNNKNLLRQIQLDPPSISDPRAGQAWGKFNLPPDDLLLHPSGAVITVNAALSRMESLKLPATATTDDAAAINLQAQLYGGQGLRPGLFNAPTVATVTAEGTILIVEAGNNRIHAVDASGNPVPLFSKQSERYFLNFSDTGGASTNYLDIAVEFSGFIYVLSSSNLVFRLDIYHPEQTGGSPITTTMGFNAAKLTVDYWRNVYSLNYEVLQVNGQIPPSNITEPSVSQWLPTAPPPCDSTPSIASFFEPRVPLPMGERRLLRRRNFWNWTARPVTA